ncbi:MAG: shikimate kinase [Ignavibacteria bacterium]|nr:shikimate kinase [Ignavibacteria bacterium]
MTKTVVMLIGPKGSGKTHIGTVVEKRLGIKFLRVEPIWLGLSNGQDGWSVVEKNIDSCLRDVDMVIIESLGGSEGFERLRANLSSRYAIRYVKVAAPLEVCAERVRNRDSTCHIPVSDDKVDAYNRLAARVSLPWSRVVTNDPPLSEDEICATIHSIQQGGQPDASGAGYL